MRVLLRVQRASVWLSPRTRARQDGFLALVKTPVGAASHVFYGTLDHSVVGTRCVAAVKYSEAASASGATRAIDVDVEYTLPATTATVEIVLFVLGTTASTTASSSRQRISCVARTLLQLSDKDLAAITNAQEVLFTSPLDGDLGSIEVMVQRADPTATTASLRDSEGGEGDEQGGSSFSVHWTSSEALERDLARKARVRGDAEQQLFTRLAAAEARAHQTVVLRDRALECVRWKRAARVIQCAYRAWRCHRREQRRQRRREREERERQQKEAVRARVVERNQRRTQRLMEQWTTVARPVDCPQTDTSREALAEWEHEQRLAVHTTLEATLARLAAERDEQLRTVSVSANRSVSNRSVRFEEPLNDDDGVETDAMASHVRLSDGLIHAIQRLHLRK